MIKNFFDGSLSLGVVFLGLIAFFATWAGYTQLALGLTPVTIFSLLAIAYSLVVAFIKRRIEHFSTIDFASFGILILAALSYYWSLNTDAWLIQLYYYILCYFTFLSTLYIVKSRLEWNKVILFLAVGSMIGMLSIGEIENEWGVALQRHSIEGLNNNYLSYILVGCISLVLVYGRVNKVSKLSWFVIWIFFAFSFYKLLSLGTRGAMGSAILLIVWFFINGIVGRRFLIALGCFSVVSLIFVSFGLLDKVLVIFDAIGLDRATGDLSGRLDVWPIARSLILDHLFFGIGIGAFANHNPVGIGAHNVVLTMLLEIGVVGFILFCLILYLSLLPGFLINASRVSRYVAGSFICYWTPIALTGHWELAIPSWLIFALHCSVFRFER